MLKFNHRTNAFSILEAALTIAIIGVAISVVFPVIQTIVAVRKQRANEIKFLEIRIAMQSYLLRNGYLPNAAGKNGVAKKIAIKDICHFAILACLKPPQKMVMITCLHMWLTNILHKLTINNTYH